jgi:MFS family permease
MIVAGLAAVNFIVMGPSYGTIGIFFSPLIKEFGCTRGQVSGMATAFLLAIGMINPCVGWLLDRIPPRIPVAIGAGATGAAFLIASQAHSLETLIFCYALAGLGVGASTILPGMVVAASWLSEQRALAIGITMAGAGVSGCVLPPVAAHLIRAYGWRVTMVGIGLPMFVLALPIIITMIRTPPEGATEEEQGGALMGLDLGPALLSLPFWLLVGVHVTHTVASTGAYFHMVPYLIEVGYPAQTAAIIFGANAAISLPGYVLLGNLADSFGPKPVLACSLILQAISMILVVGLRGPYLINVRLIIFIVLYGLPFGSGTALGSALLADSLGLKSFGSLAGIIGLIATMGSGAGPWVAGRIYDTSGRYAGAYELCAVLMLVGALFALFVYPAESLRDEQDMTSRIAMEARH